MTIYEKVEAINDYCNLTDCKDCLIYDDCEYVNGDFRSDSSVVEIVYDKIKDVEKEDITEEKVDHPNHYNFGDMETIDEMELIFGIEATMHFCLLNSWKYRARAVFKNKEQDIEKSNWYIKKYKELKEKLDELYEY